MFFKFNSKFFIISAFVIANVVGIGFASSHDNYLIQEAVAGGSPTGTIEVIKDTIGGDDTFSFSVNGGDVTFDIGTSAGTGSSGVSPPLATGAYTIEETTIPSGWTLTSIICTGGGSSTVTGSSIEVDVGAGDTVVCTFENTMDTYGTIQIVKRSIGGDDTFDFTVSGTGPSAPYSEQIVTSGGSATNPAAMVLTGTYSVNEDAPPTGWTLTDFDCSGSSTNDGTSGATGINDIEVNSGDAILCTFENDGRGQIIVEKQTVGGDDTFTFTGDAAGSISNNGQIAVTVNPGTYTSVEGANSDFELTDISCDDGNSTGDTVTRTATFNVETGETVTCTFTNNEIPTVTLNKLMKNDDGGEEVAGAFDLELDGMSWPTGVAMDVDLGDLPLAITETGPDGYVGTITSDITNTSDPECPIGDIIGVDNAEITTLTWGDHIICYVTNDDVAPTLKLIKTVTTDDGGNEVPDDWTLSATGNDDTSRDFSNLGGSGVAETVLANEQYDLDETTVAGYTEGTWDCDESGSISLDPGENVVCTIDNDDIAPLLTVTKELVNTHNDVTTVPDDFALTVGGVGVLSGVQNSFDANTALAIDETVVSGYQFLSFSGDCPPELGDTITMNEGDVKSCTITNQGIGTIQIVKESIGGDDTFGFAITDGPSASPTAINEQLETVGPPTGINSDTFNDSGMVHNVVAGAYTITETMNNAIGWEIQSITCGGDHTVNLGSQSVEIDVNPGDDVVCTFVNKDTKDPVVTVPADFRVEDDGATVGDNFDPLSATDEIDPNPNGPECTVNNGATVVTSPDDIPGIGTHTVTCETFDLAGNTDSDTFDVTLMEITVDAASSFKFDHSQFSGSGEVFGSVGTDLVEIVVSHPINGDTTLLSDIVISGGDMDGTWSFSGETLPADNIEVNTIQARLVADNPGTVATSGGDDTFAVLPHDIEVEISTCGGDDTGVMWDHTICLDATVTDLDFVASEDTGNLGDVGAGHEICYSDKGVNGENTQCFTLNPDENGISTTGGDDTAIDVIAGEADDVGNNRNVVATFDLNNAEPRYGNSAVTNEDGGNSFALNLEAHRIDVTVSTCGGDDTNVKWDHTVCLDTTVEDLDFVASVDTGNLGDVGSGHEICYSDKAIAGENVQCSTLNPHIGKLSTTGGDDTPQVGIADDVGSARNLVATFDLNNAEPRYGNSAVTNEDGGNSFALNLLSHNIDVVISTCGGDDTSVMWDHTLCLDTSVEDLDFIAQGDPEAKVNYDTGDLNDDVICYSDKGVAGEDVQCFTLDTGNDKVASTGEETIQAGTADDSGDNKNVVATFDKDNAEPRYGNSAVTNEDGGNSFALNLEPHRTDLPLADIPNIVEKNQYIVSGILTDLDRVFSDSPHALVNFDTGNPSFAKTTLSTLEGDRVVYSGELGDPTGETLTASFTRGITIIGSAGGDDTFADTEAGIKILKLHEGAKIQMPEIAAAVSIDIRNLDSEDTVRIRAESESGAIFESVAVGVDQDPIQPWNVNTDYGESDIVKHSGLFWASLYGDPDDEDAPAPTNTGNEPGVAGSEDDWVEVTVTPDYAGFLASVIDGIREIEIIDVVRADGEETADISGIRISDPRGEPDLFLELDFDELDDLNPAALHLRGDPLTNTFAPGSYHGLATADPDDQGVLSSLGASYTPLVNPVTSQTIGNAYLGSVATPQEFKVLASSWGVGGQSIGVVSDSGQGFTGKSCGADKDNDGICTWDESTKQHKVTGGYGTPIFVPIDAGLNYEDPLNVVPQTGTTSYHADVFVELDIMKATDENGNPVSRIDEEALGQVQEAFRESFYRNENRFISPQDDDVTCPNWRCGINLHFIIDETDLEKVDQLEVWQDFDTIEDDFAHIKSLHFNTKDARAVLGGTQTSTFTEVQTGVSEDDDEDGMTDEDPIGDSDSDGNPNDDMDCTNGTEHFFGDYTDTVPDECYDSAGNVVNERFEINSTTCVDIDGLYAPFTGAKDGTLDDCFDENNNIRTGVTEIIDEDFVTDLWEWEIDGITLESPENALYETTRGRIYVEEAVVFDTPVLDKHVILKQNTDYVAPAGIPTSEYKYKRFSSSNSAGSHPTDPNSLIFSNNAEFDVIDTDTITAPGYGDGIPIPVGKITVEFQIPTGVDVVSSSKWRISPDVITNFDNERAEYFHYGLVADSIGPCGPSGIAELNGNDFIISLGCGFAGGILDPTPDPNNNNQQQTKGSVLDQGNTIMHELGHNFGLLHGGDDDVNCKPNYDSVMSYTQQSTLWIDNQKPDYSDGLFDDLDEQNLPDESKGLFQDKKHPRGGSLFVWGWEASETRSGVSTNRAWTPGPDNIKDTADDIFDNVNWNDKSGSAEPAGLAQNVNFIPDLEGCNAEDNPDDEIHSDFDDWNNLDLIFSEEGVKFDGVTACATCITDFTSSSEIGFVNEQDWYDGLIRHNQLSPPNKDIFTEVITQQVESGQNLDVSFQIFNCNPNKQFDNISVLPGPDGVLGTVDDIPNPNFGGELPDQCRDVNGVVKRLGFYSEPVDPDAPQNTIEAACPVEDEDCEELANIIDAGLDGIFGTPDDGEKFFLEIQRVLELDSGDTTPTELISFEDAFHVHFDGVTSWYHFAVDTTDLPLGQYSANILRDMGASEPDTLYDYNNQLFNPSTGNFQAASFIETIPTGSLAGNAGVKTTFLFDIVEAP